MRLSPPVWHDHFWLAGVLTALAGVAILTLAPQHPAISASLLLFAGFHVLGGIIALSSLAWLVRGECAARPREFDFGGGRGGALLLIAAAIAFGAAVFTIAAAPWLWALAFVLIAQATLFVAGRFALTSARHPDAAVLPLLPLPGAAGVSALVLGCGAGRATIAVARGLAQGRIVALDRFKTREHERFVRNLALAGLADRVEICDADLGSTPFDDEAFTLIVATHVFDHLRKRERAVLKEARRLLAPSGRLVLTLWTPSWSLFAVVSFAAFAFRRESAWRELLEAEGLAIVQEFRINSGWGVVAERR